MISQETINKIEGALHDVPYGEAKHVIAALNGAPVTATRRPQHAALKDALATAATGKRRGRPPKAAGAGDADGKKTERADYARGYRAGAEGKPSAVSASEAYLRGWKAGYAKANAVDASPAPAETAIPIAPPLPAPPTAPAEIPVAPVLPVSA